MRSSTSLGAPQPRRRYHTRTRRSHGRPRGGRGLCPRTQLHPPGNLVRVQSRRLGQSRHPGASPGLIPHRQAQVSGSPPPPPPPSALFPPDSSGIARRLPGNCTGGGPQTRARTRGRSSPRDLATPTVLEPRDRLSHPPRSIQVCFHILALHPSAHLEGTRGLSFWREPHQVRETHKAMGRWEPNLG